MNGYLDILITLHVAVSQTVSIAWNEAGEDGVAQRHSVEGIVETLACTQQIVDIGPVEVDNERCEDLGDWERCKW